MNWRQTLACFAISLLGMLISPDCTATNGQVFDAESGKPLTGVDIIGAWEVSHGLVISSTGCAKLDIAQTDAQGRFELPSWTGNVLSKLFGDEGISVYYYKRGYRWKSGAEWKREPILMERDLSSPMERMELIGTLGGKTDCGSTEERRRKALPVMKRIRDEASDLAVSREERERAIHLNYWVDRLEFGERQAKALVDKRLQELWYK